MRGKELPRVSGAAAGGAKEETGPDRTQPQTHRSTVSGRRPRYFNRKPQGMGQYWGYRAWSDKQCLTSGDVSHTL